MNFLGVSFLLQLRITLRVYYIVYERGPGDLDNVSYSISQVYTHSLDG